MKNQIISLRSVFRGLGGRPPKGPAPGGGGPRIQGAWPVHVVGPKALPASGPVKFAMPTALQGAGPGNLSGKKAPPVAGRGH